MNYSEDFIYSFNFLYKWEQQNPKIDSEIVNQVDFDIYNRSRKRKSKNISFIQESDLKEFLFIKIWEQYDLSNFVFPLNFFLFNTYYDFNEITVERMLAKCSFDIECLCENRINRRLNVLNIYEEDNQYNLISLKKDYEIKDLCT